jgi:exosome complex exonuclease RRP6
MGMIAANKNGPSHQQVNNNSQHNESQKYHGNKSLSHMIQRPQKLFKDKIDNSYLPFVPKLRQKPNALRPLAEIFTKLDKLSKIEQDLFDENLDLLENPYLYEIEQFEPNEQDLASIDHISKPISIELATYKYIETVEDLAWLCDYLGKENRSRIREIAVDLEHHSYRSFLGFTCLMQISTRTDDFVIDTLKLRSDMHRLNEIFTDWTLLKVLHGADFDIEWLQKDFGIYVVNMFDTGQASRVLQYPHFSLSYLLQKFCGIQAQKQHQLADWRQRPLGDELIRYAREDTRYLLYIYDNLRNELIKSQQLAVNSNINEHTPLLKLVYEKSKLICKKAYKKPVFYSKGFLNLCQHNAHLNAKQIKALHDLYAWRDRVARESDESCEYVLKSHQLLKIAELLPREIFGILALCNPISSLLESNVHQVHEIVQKAREYKGTLNSIQLSLNLNENGAFNGELANGRKVVEEELVNKSNVMDKLVHFMAYDSESILNCPHDLSHRQQDKQQHQGGDDDLDESTFQHVDLNETKNLNDLLIKPNNQLVQPALPADLINISSSAQSRLFHKKPLNSNENRKLIDKVNFIREQIKNPFELFLPNELRANNNDRVDESEYWNLIKTDARHKRDAHIFSTDANQEEATNGNQSANESSMIPLKQQFKFEKFVASSGASGQQKAKKKKKDVDFTDAIIEYNRKKMKTEPVLGDRIEEGELEEIEEEEKEKFDQLAQKIQDNLKSLSDSVKNATFTGYDAQQMNKMFQKPSQSTNESGQHASRQSKYGKINKRRNTNAVTRSKHNQSATFRSNSK